MAKTVHRNIAFLGHSSAGKTTMVDALAFELGASDRKGSVGDKTSICDTEPEEQERQHTLQLAVVHAKQGGISWNLIDTPGYPEFAGDTLSAIFASDLVVGVLSCASGLSFNFVSKMRTAAEMNRSRAIIVTHLDAENADYDALITKLRQVVGEICVPVQVPDHSGTSFSAVLSAGNDSSMHWQKRLNDRVMDACDDEDVVMEYLESETLTEEQCESLIPTAIAKGALVPVLVCNPKSGVGVKEALEFLTHYAPCAETHANFCIDGQDVVPDSEGETLGVVFDVKSDPHVGRICLARILRGSLRASDFIGPGKGSKPGGLFHPVGGKGRESADQVSAGDICAFSKIEDLAWGDTFAPGGATSSKVDMPELPLPMVAVAIEPKSRNDEQKIGEALHRLEAEDSGLKTEVNPLTHELVLHGMSDLHLLVVESRLKRRYHVEIEKRLPRIAYRETVTKSADGHHRHKKQSGGRGQFGECYLRIRPGKDGSGIVFENKVVGGNIPRNLIPAIEKGLRDVAARGILTHSQVVDIEVEVYDGKHHAVDSDEASFKKAGAMAFRDAFGKAAPVLQEPVMAVEIKLPAESSGAVFSDITSHRRGQVLDQTSEEDGHVTVVQAQVPLATMLTYHRDLKSQTGGEGVYSLVLDHYARVPGGEQQKILAAEARRAEEE